MPSITLIPGDGIGPEIVSSVRAVFSAMNIPLEINEAIAGGAALAEGLDLIPRRNACSDRAFRRYAKRADHHPHRQRIQFS